MTRVKRVAKKRNTTTAKQSASKVQTSAAGEADSHALPPEHDAAKFAENMLLASRLWQRIMGELSVGYLKDPELSVGHSDPFRIGDSFMKMASKMLTSPQQLCESQVSWWKSHMDLWHRTTHALLGNSALDPSEVGDRRFKDDAWNDNSYFDYVRRSYLLNSEWMKDLVNHVPGLDAHTAHKVDFFTRQLLDALSPSNFLLTNPEVQKTTLQSNGENLVKGLKRMLEDVQRGDGKLRISMTDDNAFELGKNIASSNGMVVYENDLMQLIQFAPTTKRVFEVPLLITPAWINKYYILDLQAKNSFVKWLCDQGYTVFVISWVNPDEALAGKRFDDYLQEGPLAALDVIEAITGSDVTNLIGYCLGGTLTAITLAYLRAHGQAHRVGSATYLTTMLDFTDAGDLSVFIDEEQLASLEERMAGKGYLEAADMSNTFNMLRSNDLIWSFVVNHYLLGKEPFPFDLLYWNADATRMPAAMHSFYLRNMYLKNLLAKAGGIELLDTPINITKIQTPAFMLSTKEDHIAPWKSTYLGTQIFDGPTEFVLAQSGHIAGVISPPNKKKYGFWSNNALPQRADDWFAKADFTEATSWWPRWHAWQQAYAGKQVAPPAMGGKHYPPIEAAPGAYARMQA